MEEQLNLGEYTYKQGVKVEIEGGTLIALLNHLNMVANQETKTVFPLGENGFPDVNNPEVRTSPLGATAISILPALEQAHTDCIKGGKATHISELQKPAFEEVKEEVVDTKVDLEVEETTPEAKTTEKKKTTMKVSK